MFQFLQRKYNNSCLCKLVLITRTLLCHLSKSKITMLSVRADYFDWIQTAKTNLIFKTFILKRHVAWNLKLLYICWLTVSTHCWSYTLQTEPIKLLQSNTFRLLLHAYVLSHRIYIRIHKSYDLVCDRSETLMLYFSCFSKEIKSLQDLGGTQAQKSYC